MEPTKSEDFHDFNVEEDDMDDDQGSVKGTKEKAAERAREELARKETKAVRCLRLTMGSTLVVVAVSICLVVYHYTRNVEHDEFGNHYRSISVTLIDNFHSTFEQKLSAFDVLSASITRHARATNVSSQQNQSLTVVRRWPCSPDFLHLDLCTQNFLLVCSKPSQT